MDRIVISLEHQEMTALLRLSQSEYRDPRLQVALLIRQELERRGLIEDRNRSLQAANNPKEANRS
jgi:hypothetical protein